MSSPELGVTRPVPRPTPPPLGASSRPVSAMTSDAAAEPPAVARQASPSAGAAPLAAEDFSKAAESGSGAAAAAATPGGTAWQSLPPESHWAAKIGIRFAICVLGLIGVGCAAAVLGGVQPVRYVYSYYFVDRTTSAAALAVIGTSMAWCITALLVRLLRRSRRPVHPGVVVGLDLVLWLVLIIVALSVFTGAAIGLQYFGNDPTNLEEASSEQGYYDGYYYYGNYYLNTSSNNWVYNVTRVRTSSSTRTSRFNATSGRYYYVTYDRFNITRDCSPIFSTCADQDNYVNRIWHDKPSRFALNIVTGVCMALILVGHFILFVWACIDVHRRRRMRSAQVVSQAMVQGMINRGEVVFNPATQQPQWAWYGGVPAAAVPPSSANGEKPGPVYGGPASGPMPVPFQGLPPVPAALPAPSTVRYA